MTELTTFIKTTAIMSVGIIEDKRDPLATIFPFYMTELYNATGKVKRVFCNYSFGIRGVDDKPVYDSNIGHIKEKMFIAIRPEGKAIVIGIEDKTYDAIKGQVEDHLWAAPTDTLILFVINRKVAEEAPFFEAIGIQTGDTLNPLINPPLTLEEVGMTVARPFVSITRKQLDEASMQVHQIPKPRGRR